VYAKRSSGEEESNMISIKNISENCVPAEVCRQLAAAYESDIAYIRARAELRRGFIMFSSFVAHNNKE